MKELTDIVQAIGQAIPQMQTLGSFAGGLIVGGLIRATTNQTEYWPGSATGAVTLGAIISGKAPLPDFIVDSSAALIGGYFGFKIVDRLTKALYDR